MALIVKIPCYTCNGDGFVSHEDRHVENCKEVCQTCKGEGEVDPRTGQGPQSSASPDGKSLYAHRIETPDGVHHVMEVVDPIVGVIDASKLKANEVYGSFGARKPTRLTQLYRHDPPNGVYGDCQRTCLAMLLGFSTPEHVPHFGSDGPPDGVFWDRVHAWLGEMGYRIWQSYYADETPLDTVMRTQGILNPGVFWMLAGKSPRGTQHVVVCLGDAVWCDPHPDGGGIVGPGIDSYYRVEVLVPVSMSTFQRPRGHEDLPEKPGPV